MSENEIEILDFEQNQEEELIEGIEGIEESKLLQSIWLRPKDTLRYILKKCPDKYITQLLIIGGAVSALGNALDGAPLFDLGPWFSLVVIVIIGAILGPLANMVFAAILSMVGRWIGGKGNYSRTLTIVAWSMVPNIAGVVLLFFQIGFFGPYFTFYSGDIEIVVLGLTKSEMILYLLAFLSIVVSIWAAVLLVIGLSLAHNFGIGKAILNLVIPVLIIVIPIGIFAFIMGDLFNTF
ncbi:Yip1 family protein [Cryomorphaceae bacterium 1068]|nr:Yip1 family protein [Cryomorphaceae bacterium 1068]